MVRELRYCERTADTVITVIHIINLLIVLALDVERQYVTVRPSWIAQFNPVLIILSRASHIGHTVHNARAAENLKREPHFNKSATVENIIKSHIALVKPMQQAYRLSRTNRHTEFESN